MTGSLAVFADVVWLASKRFLPRLKNNNELDAIRFERGSSGR